LFVAFQPKQPCDFIVIERVHFWLRLLTSVGGTRHFCFVCPLGTALGYEHRKRTIVSYNFLPMLGMTDTGARNDSSS
jgi:hypothetical protein